MTPRLVRHWEGNTISAHPRLELVSAFVLAPLVEEAIFRFAFFRLALSLRVRPRPAALGSAVLFGLMHQRFGPWFVGYAFIGGLVLWATFTRTGYWGAVLLHAGANLVDLSVGWRRRLSAAGSGGKPPQKVARPADIGGRQQLQSVVAQQLRRV